MPGFFGCSKKVRFTGAFYAFRRQNQLPWVPRLFLAFRRAETGRRRYAPAFAPFPDDTPATLTLTLSRGFDANGGHGRKVFLPLAVAALALDRAASKSARLKLLVAAGTMDGVAVPGAPHRGIAVLLPAKLGIARGK